MLVGVLIAQYAFGDLEHSADLDQGGYTGVNRRLDLFFADPAEAKRAASGLAGDAKQIVAFGQTAHGAAITPGTAPF